MSNLTATIKPQTAYHYEAYCKQNGNNLKLRILRGKVLQNTVSLPLLGGNDILRFVKFLNTNEVEPVHIGDCFNDFIYENLILCEKT